MLSRILPYMRCPRCLGTPLRNDGGGVACFGCKSRFPLKDGILDMLGVYHDEVITPFQKLMQTAAIVAIYEKLWRRIGYFIASSRAFEREVETVLRFSEGKPTDRMLDLACGTGVFTRPLAYHGGGDVIGLDMSMPMLNRAQHLIQKEGIRNIQLIRATALRMPFIDGAFPYVNCCGALHLFDKPDSVLREIGRILSAGGHLCVQTTIRPQRSAGMAYLLERLIRFGFFEETKLIENIMHFGFHLVECERHRISYTFSARFVAKATCKS
jgi:ubiquinone/menaquinone biosynthesis C-methylase UbiE